MSMEKEKMYRSWMARTFNCKEPEVTFEIFKLTPWSRIWKVNAPGIDSHYLKENPDTFPWEGPIIEYLSSLSFESLLPEMLGYDIETNSILTKPASGEDVIESLKGFDAVEKINHIMESYVYLQSTADVDTLSQFGARQYETSKLYELCREAFRDMLPCLPVASSIRLEAVVKHFSSTKKHFTDFIGSNSLPDRMEHSDFHLGNILLNNGHYIFIDFAECAISNPVFSFLSLRDSLTKRLGFDFDSLTIDLCTDHYLNLMSKSFNVSVTDIGKLIAYGHDIYPFYYLLTMRDLIVTAFNKTGTPFRSGRFEDTIAELYAKFN